jgi:hypothetical protein
LAAGVFAAVPELDEPFDAAAEDDVLSEEDEPDEDESDEDEAEPPSFGPAPAAAGVPERLSVR